MKRLYLLVIVCLSVVCVNAQQRDSLIQKQHRFPRRASIPSQRQSLPNTSLDASIQKQNLPTATSDSLGQNVSAQTPDTNSQQSETPSDQTNTQSVSTNSNTQQVDALTQDKLAQSKLVLPAGSADTTTFSFRDTDLRDIIRSLAVRHNFNVSVDNNINKRVTISLNKVQVYDAMKFICQQNNLRLQLEGGIFKIMFPPAPPKAEPPPPKIPWVYYENNLLSVKLKNDDIEAVVIEIQKKSGKNILILSGTNGNISGTLTDIDFDLGLTQLLNNNGFAVQKKSGIYIVSRLDYFVGQQSGTQGQRGGAYWISVKDSLVTIDVTNAQLDRVLADVIRQLNTDVVFYNTVTGTVTARATNLPLSKTLDMILRNTNFSYRESEGIYFIGEKTNKALMTTKLIKLKYLRTEKILDMVPQSISSQATLKVMKEHNGIVIVAPGDVISQADEFFRQIDKPVAQVLIEAIVVDFDRSKGFELGIGAGYKGSRDSSGGRSDIMVPGIDFQANGPDISSALKGIINVGKLPSNFYLSLKALEEKRIANIRSRPLIATLNGTPASLSIGTTFYFKLNTTTLYSQNLSQMYPSTSEQFKEIIADTKLEITPFVGADGQITVEIKPDFKTPKGSPANGIPPPIDSRTMSSTLIMREGETIVLGGIIQEIESETRTQTPILGSIPLLGYLFSSTSKKTDKTELMIYVTPHISYGEAFQNVNLPVQPE